MGPTTVTLKADAQPTLGVAVLTAGLWRMRKISSPERLLPRDQSSCKEPSGVV